MKSFFIWLAGTLIGAALGYAFSFLLNISVLILIMGGLLLGSTVAITYNIHREEELELEDFQAEDTEASS